LLNGGQAPWHGLSIPAINGLWASEAASAPRHELPKKTEPAVGPVKTNQNETAATKPEVGPPATEPPTPNQETKVEPVPTDPKPEAPATTTPEPDPLPPVFQPGKAAGELWAGNSLNTPFRWCPPGTFTMGSPKGEPGRTDVESETITEVTDGFFLGQFE